jgi:hypothetical protein
LEPKARRGAPRRQLIAEQLRRSQFDGAAESGRLPWSPDGRRSDSPERSGNRLATQTSDRGAVSSQLGVIENALG